jgi:hypothetical protein
MDLMLLLNRISDILFKKPKFKWPHPTTSSWELVSWTYLVHPSPTHTTNRCENLKLPLTFLNDCSRLCMAKRRIPMGQSTPSITKMTFKAKHLWFSKLINWVFQMFLSFLIDHKGIPITKKIIFSYEPTGSNLFLTYNIFTPWYFI